MRLCLPPTQCKNWVCIEGTQNNFDKLSKNPSQKIKCEKLYENSCNRCFQIPSIYRMTDYKVSYCSSQSDIYPAENIRNRDIHRPWQTAKPGKLPILNHAHILLRTKSHD